jgi:hypothetical protein
MDMTSTFPTHPGYGRWMRRAGVFSFWLFFIKGLLWLAAPLVFYFLS